ncbi:DUF3667 domain-containing protein [Microbulbifer sp. GL-2]|uniref:DUF3667 domain-containing protein n=1 Tax=Microbulbifer sp. GL-2 TaxID=2591606 RepID=UPI00116584DE|nr:DUF3667 domain-containing protein [Microbulbifer sp. GL-2]BBM00198.1 hypothetical protein GL2_02720 [Microbulbifer sp. GL-2]
MKTSDTADSYADPKLRCANCDTELMGPHCYACGQPVEGMVRQFSNVIGDLLSTLLVLDSRIWRTLPSLLFKPGFLSSEYFAGRRARYVSPVRLFIFLCLTSFLMIRLGSDWAIDVSSVEMELAQVNNIESKHNATEEGANNAERPSSKGIETALNKAITKIDQEVLQSISLPESWIDWTNKEIVKARKNVIRVSKDPNHFKKAFFSALPSSLLIMVPIFALLLWVIYALKGRLYMEHLIVTLHSHAFICFSLLLATLMMDAQEWLKNFKWIEVALSWGLLFLLGWIPVYLLIMQKRVYQQGWLMTLSKYIVIAIIYPVLLAFFTTMTALYSLAEL